MEEECYPCQTIFITLLKLTENAIKLLEKMTGFDNDDYILYAEGHDTTI
jgi:hypothetical protein